MSTTTGPDPLIVAVQNDSVSAVLAFAVDSAGHGEPALRQSQVLLRVANEEIAKQRVALLATGPSSSVASSCEAGFLIADIQGCRRQETTTVSGVRVRTSVGYLLRVVSDDGKPQAIVLVRSELLSR